MSSMLQKKSGHIMDPELETFIRSRSLEAPLKKALAPLQDDSDIKRVEIIVLKYKSPEMEKDCVSRIVEYTDWPYKLNVFDNRGNGPNTSKIWNKLIKESTCDYILFIDSDAFVNRDITIAGGHTMSVCWLTEMMKAFKMWKDIAWVGPISGNRGITTMQSMKPSDRDPFKVDGHLSGYCFLTKKEIYDEVGYFDEDFCFYGQESDWIERIIEEDKYKLAVAPRAHVQHGYEHMGSLAAAQAVKDGELDIDTDSSYSYYLWNQKKKMRLEARGKKYEFDI